MAYFTFSNSLVLFVIVCGRDDHARTLRLWWIEKHETFSVAICGEVEEIGAELRYVELDLNWISIGQFLQLSEDLIMVLACVERHNHVENVILAQDTALAIDVH